MFISSESVSTTQHVQGTLCRVQPENATRPPPTKDVSI